MAPLGDQAIPVAGPSSKKPQKATRDILHPKFNPTYLPKDSPCLLSAGQDVWVTPLSAPAYFPLDAFQETLEEMSLHPEQNSSLIIRADPLPDTEEKEDAALAARLGLELLSHKRVRFIPRQPRRDARLDERVVMYSSPEGDSGVVVQTPCVSSVADIPYYFPAVRKIAFLWDSDGADAEVTEGVPRVYGRISIAYLPFPDTPRANETPLPPPPKPARRRSPLAGPPIGAAELNAGPPAPTHPATVLEEDTEEGRAEAKAAVERRLQRTCLGLLERLHKHGHGTLQGYVKRVAHDVIVSREPFQDLYQALKERHKHLDSRVPLAWSNKVEDVKRHVWKDAGSPDDRLLPTNLALWGQQDIAIAAFLMLLWRDMYPAREGTETGMEWDKWGRPPGGLVDLGCGNGLVVHILVSEGYKGRGYELRARRTWPQYPAATQASLVELQIDMPSWFPETMEQWQAGDWPGKEQCVVKEGTFLLGNHADELTPWIPLLSLLPATPVPYLNLPCCLHTLDSKFTSLDFAAPAHPHAPAGGFDEGLETGQSRYKAFTMWLGWEGLMCGWEWEKESLRIPSTRGWAIVARRRWTSKPTPGSGPDAVAVSDLEDEGTSGGSTWHADRAAREWAFNEVKAVRERGAFSIRVKEGKDH